MEAFFAGRRAALMKAAVELRSSSSPASGGARSESHAALLKRAKWIRVSGPVTIAQSTVLKHDAGSARNMAAFRCRLVAHLSHTLVWSISWPKAAPSSCSEDDEEHSPWGLGL